MVFSLMYLLLSGLHGERVRVLGQDVGIRTNLNADDPRIP